jgi:hypothetical protein
MFATGGGLLACCHPRPAACPTTRLPQMSLQQGCNTILRHDCIVLANRLYRWADGDKGGGDGGAYAWRHCKRCCPCHPLFSFCKLMHTACTGDFACRLVRSSLRRLHLLQQNGGAGASRWVLYDSRSGQETAAQDETAAALLGGHVAVAQAAAGGAGGGMPARPSSAGAAGGSAASPADAQQQQQQRVWVGFLGAPPPAAVAPQPAQSPQQHLLERSPSKFVRLASSRSSPARGATPPPRKVLVS